MTKLRRIMDDKQPTIERWKPVNGHEGIYEVSSHGRVRSVDRTVNYSNGRVRHIKGRVRCATLDRYGYPIVDLWKQGKGQTRTVHSLVAEAFVGPRPDGMQVCHNDGDPTNNRVDNLRYGTHSDNMLDRVRHGTDPDAIKKRCPRGHRLSAENISPSSARRGQRECLACNRAHSHVYRHPELKPQFKAVADSYYQAILEERKIAA